MGKGKKAQENQSFDAFLKELQQATKESGVKKAREDKKKHGLTHEDRVRAHQERHQALEKAKEAEFQRLVEHQQQQRMIQQMLQQLTMGRGLGMESPLLNKPKTDIGSDVKKSAGFDAASCAMQGWRKAMEDAHIIDLSLEADGKTGLFAVFDGHAGEKCAKACERVLPALMRKYYSSGSEVDFAKVYAEIDGGMKAKLSDGSGATAVTVLVTPKQITCANVGDSRAVLCRGGAAVALSSDHKPELEAETARIVAAGGHVEANRVNGQLAMSRAIGDFVYKRNEELPADKQLVISTPDVMTLDRVPEDQFLVVGCDGIFDVLSNEEVVEMVRAKLAEGATPEDTCKAVIAHCLAPAHAEAPSNPARAEGTDNMTLTIVKLL